MQNIILYGSGDEEIEMVYSDGMRKQSVTKTFEGVIPNLEKRWHDADASWIKEELSKFQNERRCKSCGGYRLKRESLCIKIADHHIGQISEMTISNASAWFETLPAKLKLLLRIKLLNVFLKNLKSGLGFLNNVGLDYLTLSRESGTLSGGESQRIRLASQIGSGLKWSTICA